MNMLSAAIRLYQRSAAVNTAVRLGVRAHHKLTPHGRRAICPYLGRCSATGLAAANAAGMAALPAILARMSACQAGEGYTGISVDPCNAVYEGPCGTRQSHLLPGRMSLPHPMDPGDGCTHVAPRGC